VAESFLPASSLNWFTKFNGKPAPQPAPPSLKISNYSITAVGAIRRSAIAARPNLNDVTIGGWQLDRVSTNSGQVHIVLFPFRRLPLNTSDSGSGMMKETFSNW